MNRTLQPALALFAIGILAMGVLALVVGDFAMGWQPVAPWVPGRTALAYAAAVLMVVCGAGILFEATAKAAMRVLFAYLIVWMLLKVPALVVAPQIEGVWLGFGELAMLMSGGWVLFARLEGPTDGWLSFATGDRGVRLAQRFYGLWVVPVGLSHLMYTPQTVTLVPAWLPGKVFWADLTGVGQMACGLGLLIGVLPRVAAIAEAIQVSLFALLVWLPRTLEHPQTRLPWTAFWITWVIAAAGWCVAQSVRRRDQLSEIRDQRKQEPMRAGSF
ncbi:DoxX family protein [Acidobacteria bacterium AB60]|nr:DoxX family protein [Acidobacteria bacterium AB60]